MPHPVLIVTGGSRGIGAATAKLAARELGLAICVNYSTSREAAEEVVAAIESDGGTASAVQGDVGNEADIQRIFEHADGMGTLAGLVNNAGVVDLATRVDEMTLSQLERMWRVNITGSFLCAREAVKRMSTRHGGSGGAIVNLASAAAKMGAPGTMVHYAASKGAIDSFTAGLALEVAGEGIRVNSVRPGIIDTDIHASGGDAERVQRIAATLPMPRPGTADEVAEAIIWLLSHRSSYSTGTVITVSGGRAITV
jgi:NAD(P)-dependent dehydrogenase (short-subunit alcohol dehydrogenase family)